MLLLFWENVTTIRLELHALSVCVNTKLNVRNSIAESMHTEGTAIGEAGKRNTASVFPRAQYVATKTETKEKMDASRFNTTS